MGFVPEGKVRAGWEGPSPLPSSTETSPEIQLAATRSGTPSPLKSPTATVIESMPTGKSLLANDSVWAGAGVGNSDQNNSVAAITNASFAEVLVISGTSRPTQTLVSKSRRGYWLNAGIGLGKVPETGRGQPARDHPGAVSVENYEADRVGDPEGTRPALPAPSDLVDLPVTLANQPLEVAPHLLLELLELLGAARLGKRVPVKDLALGDLGLVDLSHFGEACLLRVRERTFLDRGLPVFLAQALHRELVRRLGAVAGHRGASIAPASRGRAWPATSRRRRHHRGSSRMRAPVRGSSRRRAPTRQSRRAHPWECCQVPTPSNSQPPCPRCRGARSEGACVQRSAAHCCRHNPRWPAPSGRASPPTRAGSSARGSGGHRAAPRPRSPL